MQACGIIFILYSVVNMPEKGYFIFSLDTELGVGYFDHDLERYRLFSTDGIVERQRIQSILDLCEQYHIHGTWAIVGHLFFAKCEYCEQCLVKKWKGKFSSYDEAYGTAHPLWYGPDVVEKIQKTSVAQEIGFHGHTHETFDTMSDEQAQLEIEEWKRVAQRFGIQGVSVVFPRDRVGKLALFKKNGFENYREDVHLSLLFRNRYFGRYVKTLDHILGITTAPSYPLTPIYDEGMLRLTASQHLFAFNRGVDRLLDMLGLTTLRIRRTIRGIKRAAQRGEMFHFWAHPWEFETAGDLAKLEAVLTTVAELVAAGKMESVTMSQMAAIIRGEA